jgi:uncharacterized protein YbjT (DUF2867 family)
MLLASGWQVRGTTRDEAGAREIRAAGIDAAIADPDLVGTVFEHVDRVGLVYWLLGSAEGEERALGALHDARLERLLEKLVDTPVRGFVYEGAGTVDASHLERGAQVARAAAERWRIPVEVVAANPADWRAWREEMVAAGERALGLRGA